MFSLLLILFLLYNREGLSVGGQTYPIDGGESWCVKDLDQMCPDTTGIEGAPSMPCPTCDGKTSGFHDKDGYIHCPCKEFVPEPPAPAPSPTPAPVPCPAPLPCPAPVPCPVPVHCPVCTKFHYDKEITMPEELEEITAVVHEDKIYIIGDTLKNVIYVYNIGTGDKEAGWGPPINRPKVLEGVDRSSAVVHDNKIYIIGGYKRVKHYSNKIYVYNIGTGDKEAGWEDPIPMLEGLEELAAVVYKDKIYIIGGNTSKGKSDKIYVYDIRNKGLVSVESTMKQGLSELAAVIKGEDIYIIGGDTSGNYSNQVYIYNIPNKSTTSIPCTPSQMVYSNIQL